MGIFNSLETGDTRHQDKGHIKGISCDVRNCVYHDGDCYCTAEKIAVGPSYATTSQDTVCATFKPKQF